MRRVLARTLVAALVAAPLTVLAAPAAQASTCPLLVDVAGDAIVLTPTLTASDLDIRSADLASGATTVVATLRLTTLSPSTVGQLGARWAVSWQINRLKYGFLLDRDVQGHYSARVAGVSAPVQFAIDTSAATISWSAPRSAFTVLATPGQTFDTISASTDVLTGGVTTNADRATTTQTYVDQTAGCIPAS